jgi:hypothetical protein
MNKYLNNGQLNCPAKAKADKVIGSLSISRGTVLANVAFFYKTSKLHGRSVRILRATCSQVLEFLPSVHYRNKLIVIYNRLKLINRIEEI